jgi:hypothetical protein
MCFSFVKSDALFIEKFTQVRTCLDDDENYCVFVPYFCCQLGKRVFSFSLHENLNSVQFYFIFYVRNYRSKKTYIYRIEDII